MLRPEAIPQQLAALSDLEIVERVRGGEAALFELLMRRYNQRLYRVARSIVRDEDEAQDIMQEAYVRAYVNLGHYEGRALFSTWLTKIAVHEALARLRRRARVVRLDGAPEEEDSVEMLKSPERGPEDRASQGELSALLDAALESLPESYRLIFVMREVEGLSTAEAAQCLGLSQQNVKARLHRARAALRRHIDARIGTEARGLYAFHLSRCDQVVHNVLDRIARLPPPAKRGGPDSIVEPEAPDSG
jgi:RNA polymerase sigma-70 factor, ECF subfamily